MAHYDHGLFSDHCEENHECGVAQAMEHMPETARLLPCKLYLRLHFISGLSVTETAEKLNVSETTLRRIRNRAARYFDEHPPQ